MLPFKGLTWTNKPLICDNWKVNTIRVLALVSICYFYLVLSLSFAEPMPIEPSIGRRMPPFRSYEDSKDPLKEPLGLSLRAYANGIRDRDDTSLLQQLGFPYPDNKFNSFKVRHLEGKNYNLKQTNYRYDQTGAFDYITNSKNDTKDGMDNTKDYSPQEPKTIIKTKGIEKYRIYIEPMGRFGNQLFQVASLIGIAKSTFKKAFISPVFDSIHQVFNIPIPRRYPPMDITAIPERAYAKFQKDVYQTYNKDVKVIGYFQSWKYFRKHETLIRQTFQLKKELLTSAKKAKQKACHFLKSQNSSNNNHKTGLPRPSCEDITYIGVHIRRKDMFPNYATVPVSYLQKAFTFFRQNTKTPLFVVATDDALWCKENLLHEADVYILAPDKFANHFAVLTSCQHHIITVGTFGWWAAWLAGGSTVYYSEPVPSDSELYSRFSVRDYFPPEWIPMKG